MTKVALLGDIHLADNPPSIRTETYTEDILKKVQWCVDTAKSFSCDVVVSAGDVFHIKTPSRNSHRLVQRTGEILRSAGLPVLIVPGNHDLSHDRLDSLQRQPLGTLAKMSGINLLIGEHPDLPLFGIPYLHDWMGELPRWMGRYTEWSGNQKGEDFGFWPLMVTHAPIFPVGEDPPYEHISGDDWASMMKNGDCYYGHIHDPHGKYTPSPEFPVNLCNNGAISRGSIHEATLKRKPSMTIWDGKPGGFSVFEIPHRPAEAVFRLQEKEDADEKITRVEEFLANIGSTTLDGLSLEEVSAQARTRGLKPTTLALIEQIMETV